MHHQPRREQDPVGTTSRAYGFSTTVPAKDICWLSYYLKCVCIGCGIDFVFDGSYLDYVHANEALDPSQKRRLVELCRDVFRADYLLNQVILLDDQYTILPRTVSNFFFEVVLEEVLAGAANDSIDQTAKVQKVMVCTPQWLHAYYNEPLKRLLEEESPILLGSYHSQQVMVSSLTQIQCCRAPTTRQCEHCRGPAVPCSCIYSCPVSPTGQGRRHFANNNTMDQQQPAATAGN